MKTCSKCGVEKPLTEFSKNRSRKDGLFHYCKPCSVAAARASASKPAGKLRAQSWKLKQYGISLEDFERMLAEQEGRCAVCKVELQVGGSCKTCVVVDHCHDTGKVRGLLCSRCNVSIEMAGGTATRLRALADYVETHEGRPG